MGLDDVPSQDEIEEYRARAKSWLSANMPRLDEQAPGAEESQGPERLRDLIQIEPKFRAQSSSSSSLSRSA